MLRVLFCMYNDHQNIIHMKNILIPSTLEADTLCAVKTAINQAKGKNCAIILMLLNEYTENYSSVTVLRSLKTKMTRDQTQVLNECRDVVAATGNCTLKIHNQSGISGPLLKNLTECFAIDLVVLSSSFKNDRTKINVYCNKLILKCKCPILHMGPGTDDYEFNNALYLEYAKNKVGIQELQQLVNGQFNFKIVSQAKIEEQNSDDITSLLSETITKNNIDLLVETRQKSKLNIGRKDTTNELFKETLGLPVLSLYEEAVEA